VAFGTGQNLTEGDRSDTSQQTFYSVLDNTRYDVETSGTNKGKVKVNLTNPVPATVSGRSVLQAESVTGGTGSGTKGTGTSSSRSFWKLTTTEVTYACATGATSCTAQKGWYMDLPVSGERVTMSPAFYDGSGILEIISQKPASGSATASGEEVCAPQPQAAQTFRTLIGISSGKPATPPILDVNGDGIFNATDEGYARMTASPIELRFSTKTQQVRRGNDGVVDKLAKLPELLVRPNWRQLK
jgi:type IV pilus assembly protein PilY1